MKGKLFFFLFVGIMIPITILALTGEGTSGPVTMDTVDPEVTVNYPNGGEILYIDETHNITWNADDYQLTSNPISIYLSSDNANNYSVVDSQQTDDGSYSWQVPATQSDECLIKIYAEDYYGNVAADSSDALFSISYVPPAAPDFVDIDISNEIDAVVSWAAVDTTIFGTPIEVDGYIVLYNESPYEDSLQCYYFLGYTDSTTTTYTHQNVAQFREEMYYRIVAYKDYSGRITRLLKSLVNNKPSWFALKRRLR